MEVVEIKRVLNCQACLKLMSDIQSCKFTAGFSMEENRFICSKIPFELRCIRSLVSSEIVNDLNIFYFFTEGNLHFCLKCQTFPIPLFFQIKNLYTIISPHFVIYPGILYLNPRQQYKGCGLKNLQSQCCVYEVMLYIWSVNNEVIIIHHPIQEVGGLIKQEYYVEERPQSNSFISIEVKMEVSMG